jgi:DNA-binding CsgD family transcriptional regulator
MVIDRPLVGRREELAVVRGFLSGSSPAEGLVLTGQRGTGRSAVLQRAAAAAGASGALVLAATAAQDEARLPFAALNQMLRPVQSCFEKLRGSQNAVLSAALGFREQAESPLPEVADAAAALLRLMSTRAPVSLVVDDWHLVDDQSAEVLALLTSRLPGSGIRFLVSTTVEGDRSPALQELPSLQLAPLDPKASAQLLRERSPALTGAVSARILDEAHGYPLALTDWPDTLTDDELSGQSPLPDPLPLGPRLRAAFAPRILDLPPSARGPLLAAAIAAVGGGPHIQGPDRAALAPALRAGLVSLGSASRTAATFPHPLVRAAVLALSTSAERREAHRELARLADTPEDRARHLAASTVGPDATAAQVIEDAARQAFGRGEFGTGVTSMLLRSADLSTRSTDRSRRLALAAQAVAKRGGRLQDAADLLHEARKVDPASGGTLEAAFASAYVMLHGDGDLEGSHRTLRDAVLRRRGTSDGPDRDVTEVVRAMSGIRALGGGIARLAAPLDGEQSWSPGLDTSPLPHLFTCRTGGPSGTSGSAESDRRVRDAAAGPAGGSALRTMALLASDRLTRGRWDDAERWCAIGLEACESLGHRLQLQHFRLCEAEIAAARGNIRQAREMVLEVEAWAEPRGLGALRGRCSLVRALAATAEGDFEVAYRSASAISPAGTVDPCMPAALSAAFGLVESALRTNRRREAAAHARALRESGVAALSPGMAMVVGAASGMTAPDDRVRFLFDDALSAGGLERWPFELARVQLIYGERLRRMRARGDARPHLAAALDAFERLGATPWAARARVELNATGGTEAVADAHTITRLTPQEREVAMLAASGLTNGRIAERLFVSPRTVGAHLRQVFAKLGVASRASLRDALGRELVEV